MPNQRDDQKRSLSMYLWENDKEVLKKLADEHGMTLTEVVEFLISEINNQSELITEKKIKKWKPIKTTNKSNQLKILKYCCRIWVTREL